MASNKKLLIRRTITQEIYQEHVLRNGEKVSHRDIRRDQMEISSSDLNVNEHLIGNCQRLLETNRKTKVFRIAND